jgi:tRNA (guanine-N7-)-methyltransferase
LQRLIYGRRKGHRLRPGRRRLLEELLPRVLVRPRESGSIDPALLFAEPRAGLWLEIGFGGGEHLVAQAAARPEVGLIGCEPYVSGVARALSLIQERGLGNIRLFMDDARLLMAALPDACLERIFVLFPDPWPKTRHHKRRIVNPQTAAEFARLLRPGGELRLATDDMSYVRAMLLVLRARPELAWPARGPADWRSRPADWPPTRYEEKALAAGRACVYLRFLRVEARPRKLLKAAAKERI